MQEAALLSRCALWRRAGKGRAGQGRAGQDLRRASRGNIDL